MRTMMFAGGDLFHIAAAVLGDATQWIRIAQLNKLADPQLDGITALLIPAPDPRATGGIVDQ